MSSERWLVSYADFMTLMFAVFVMLWSTSTIDASKYRGIGDALAEMSADYDEKMFRKGDTPQQQMKHIAEGLVKVLVEIDNGDLVKVSYDTDKVRVMLSADLAFNSGQAALLDAAKPVLKLIFEQLINSDFVTTPKMFLDIVGHTDNYPINSTLYPSNWELSAARAASVARFATTDFPIRNKIRVIGYADTKPVALNENDDSRAKNRRVELMLFMMPEEVDLSSDNAEQPSDGAESSEAVSSSTEDEQVSTETTIDDKTTIYDETNVVETDVAEAKVVDTKQAEPAAEMSATASAEQSQNIEME